MRQKLIFFCPSKEIGGTEVLFSRLVLKLLKLEEIYKIEVLEMDGDVLSTLFPQNNNIEFIKSLAVEDHHTVIFTPAKCLHQLYEFLKGQNISGKLLVWQLGNGGLSETLFLPFWLKFKFERKTFNHVKSILSLFFNNSLKNAKQFLTNLISKKSITFTDKVGILESFNDLDIDLALVDQVPILPIFVEAESNNYRVNVSGLDNSLSIGWVGRISNDFKIHSLTFAINAIIDKYSNSLNELSFHIVGDGDALYKLKQIKAEKEEKHKNVKINLYGALDNKKSVEILLATSDIVIGMGTASLDVAKFGIPSLIVNPVTQASQSDLIKFRWLFDSLGFSLGEFPNNITIPNQNGYSDISILIDQFLLDPKKISLKTYEFLDKHFTSDIAIDKLSDSIRSCNYSITEFLRDFKPIYYRRLSFKKLTQFYQPSWLPK